MSVRSYRSWRSSAASLSDTRYGPSIKSVAPAECDELLLPEPNRPKGHWKRVGHDTLLVSLRSPTEMKCLGRRAKFETTFHGYESTPSSVVFVSVINGLSSLPSVADRIITLCVGCRTPSGCRSLIQAACGPLVSPTSNGPADPSAT